MAGDMAKSLPQNLLAEGIGIRSARWILPNATEFALHTNETILRRPIGVTLDAFTRALG